MASKKEFVEYLCGQMANAGEITYKPMFGEYGFYLDGIYIGAICDGQLFFKVTAEGRAILEEEVLAPMYQGAKTSFLIEQIEDRDYLCALALATRVGLTKKKKS